MTVKTIINTITASIAAPIVCLIVSAVAGGIFAIMQTIMTVIRPGIIGFFAVIIGTFLGMGAARAVCDRFLVPYQRQTVFIVFTILAMFGMIFMFLFRPLTAEQINAYVQLITLAVTSYMMFWKCDYI